MRDQRTSFVLAFLMMCVIILLMTIFASASLNTGSSARAFCLYEPTRNAILDSKNPDLKLPMASTTKIMTGILAIEYGQLDELIEIPKEATGIEGSSVYLKPNDRLTCRDLVYSLLLQSANDAACALAYAISGDVSEFVNLMNDKADKIGLKNTHFDNPHGLDSETHYTTARDLAILSAYALQNDIFCEVVSTYSYSFYISEKPRNLVNHNKLLKSCDGCIGIKTGFTDESGRCLVSAAIRNGVTLIAVTLNDPTDWADHKRLYDVGFSSISKALVSDFLDNSLEIPILGAKEPTVSAIIDFDEDDYLVKLNPDETVNIKLQYNPMQSAPISIDEKIGEAVVMVDNSELARYDILSKENILPQKQKFSIFN